MIKEDYCSFEVARLLKEKGFDIPVWTRYEDNGKVIFGDKYNWNNSPMGQTSAPTLQMAMKWLRKEHKLYITISHRFSHNADQDVCFSYYINVDRAEDGEYMTYEEAVGAALKYTLENLI